MAKERTGDTFPDDGLDKLMADPTLGPAAGIFLRKEVGESCHGFFQLPD